MGFGESTIESIDWSELPVLSGSGDDLAQALTKLINARAPDECERLWWRLENVAFSQNTVYGASEAAIGVALAALADDRPRFVRAWLIELLRSILQGGSTEEPELPDRCRQRARDGIWLLALEARHAAGPERDAVLEVVELIAPELAAVLRPGLESPAGGPREPPR
jgi:hypothetical protein